jgi:hypothetical protein
VSNTGSGGDVRRARRIWLAVSSLGGAAVVLWIALALGGHLRRGGLRPCDRLDERLCADLGATDCAFWKTRLGRAGSGSSEPHELRRNRTALVDLALHKALGWSMATQDNPRCYDQLTDDLYPQTLGVVRTIVAKGRSAQSP